MDPRVLTVRTAPPFAHPGRLFDLGSCYGRVVRDHGLEHAVLESGGELVRLDVVEGTLTAGAVMLVFDLADDECLEARVAAMRALRGVRPAKSGHERLAMKLTALWAADARAAGASLREIALAMLGPGEWPGDGEHRKSRVRRLINEGKELIAAGPRPWLLRSHSSMG